MGKAACFESRISQKQNVSSPLTREDLILWGASVTERGRARPRTARARLSNLCLEGSVISPSFGGSLGPV